MDKLQAEMELIDNQLRSSKQRFSSQRKSILILIMWCVGLLGLVFLLWKNASIFNRPLIDASNTMYSTIVPGMNPSGIPI
jgi:hypothetical protein